MSKQVKILIIGVVKRRGKGIQEEKEHFPTSGSWVLSWKLCLWQNLVSGPPRLIILLPTRCAIQAWQSDKLLCWLPLKSLQAPLEYIKCRIPWCSLKKSVVRHLKSNVWSYWAYLIIISPLSPSLFLLNQANTAHFREKLKMQSILLVKLWNTECFTRDIHNILATSIRKLINA